MTMSRRNSAEAFSMPKNRERRSFSSVLSSILTRMMSSANRWTFAIAFLSRRSDPTFRSFFNLYMKGKRYMNLSELSLAASSNASINSLLLVPSPLRQPGSKSNASLQTLSNANRSRISWRSRTRPDSCAFSRIGSSLDRSSTVTFSMTKLRSDLLLNS